MNFAADDEDACAVSLGGGEDVSLATIFQFQAAAQLGHAEGEVARRDVGLRQCAQCGLQVALYIYL